MVFQKTAVLSLAGVFLLVPASFAQQAAQPAGPTFHVSGDYAQRTTNAVNYSRRNGTTKIDFEGTPLLKKANGEAKVEAKKGYTEIEAEFDDLTPATQFGPEYLTYVLWAITPEGRPKNLGELLLDGNRGKLNVTTDLQVFSLLVTAEPYFSVTQPSDTVVLENIVRGDTVGKIEVLNAKFELMKRGSYVKNVKPGSLGSRRPDSKTPLELIEAENAIKLARAAGAEEYAKDTFDKAVANFNVAEKNAAKGSTRKQSIAAAREAVQVAEDARLITVKRQEEERLAEERRIATEKTNAANEAAAASAARAAAEADARRIADANAQQAAAQRLIAEAEKAKADAAKAQADALAAQAALRAEAEAQARRTADANAAQSNAAKLEADAARQEADKARIAAENARNAAKLEADRLAKEREAAEAARALAVQAQQDSQRQAAELAAKLQAQLNSVLETKQSARGLIVNMSDVLFDINKATLKPDAREKLARVSGILITHSDLKVEVEGHTDSTGSDELNQKLSEARAAAARDFLVGNGIPTDNVTAKGFGKTRPVESNDTSAGRAKNRRVELVISGASITSQPGATSSAP